MSENTNKPDLRGTGQYPASRRTPTALYRSAIEASTQENSGI